VIFIKTDERLGWKLARSVSILIFILCLQRW